MPRSSPKCAIVKGSIKETFAKAGEIYAKKALSEIASDIAFYAYHEGGLTPKNFTQTMLHFSQEDPYASLALTEFKAKIDTGLKTTYGGNDFVGDYLASLEKTFEEYFSANSIAIKRNVAKLIKSRSSDMIQRLMKTTQKYAPQVKKHDSQSMMVRKIASVNASKVLQQEGEYWIERMVGEKHKTGTPLYKQDIFDHIFKNANHDREATTLKYTISYRSESLLLGDSPLPFNDAIAITRAEDKRVFDAWWQAKGEKYFNAAKKNFASAPGIIHESNAKEIWQKGEKGYFKLSLKDEFTKGIEMLSKIPGITEEVDGIMQASTPAQRSKYYNRIGKKVGAQIMSSLIDSHGELAVAEARAASKDDAYDVANDFLFDLYLEHPLRSLIEDGIDATTPYTWNNADEYWDGGYKDEGSDEAMDLSNQSAERVLNRWWNKKRRDEQP
jgi:hypothetical protein